MCNIELKDMKPSPEARRAAAGANGVAAAPAAADGAGPAVLSPIVHTVVMSDTYASLSLRYSVSAHQIQRFNGIKPGDPLWCRREVRIPLPAPKTVATTEARGKSPGAAPATNGHGSRANGTPSTPPARSMEAAPVVVVLTGAHADATPPPGSSNGGDQVMQSFRSFLSRCDREISSIRTRAEEIGAKTAAAPDVTGHAAATHRTPTRLLSRTMQTTAGRLRAEDQAQEVIKRLLISDFDAARDRSRSATPEQAVMKSVSPPPAVAQQVERGDSDNDLENDTAIFDL